MGRRSFSPALLWAALAFVFAVFAPEYVRVAHAQTTTEGVVVALENDEIVVDLGVKRGASDGDVVELWRPLKLKHPVTGKMVTDRFRIGSLKLTQVRDTLSLARAEGKLTRAPAVGDVVVLRGASPPEPAAKPTPSTKALPPAGKPPAAPAKPPPGAPGKPEEIAPGAVVVHEPEDPETKLVRELFDGLRGADVTRRIIAYETYVRQHQNGRYAVVLWEEAANLRRLLALESTSADSQPKLENFQGPDAALAGVPIELGVEIAGRASGAVLQARRSGEVAYVPTPMTAAGDGYYTAVLPAERVQTPAIAYFIEAVTTQGKRLALVGSADEPRTIDIHAIPQATPPLRNEATASIWSDYADYNRLKRNDVVWQTEGFVGMRFGDQGLRAVRTGFGIYRGIGGSLEDLDKEHKSGRKVGLTYGYLEFEPAFNSFTSLIARGVLGLRDNGITGGAQLLVRIGNDKKTNLMIGGEVLGGVGLRGITELQLNVFENVPIMFRGEVTNQPAGTSTNRDEVRPAEPGATPDSTSLGTNDVGGRAIAQVGYQILPGFVIAARGSYQGRNINHAGPGFGGAVTYTW